MHIAKRLLAAAAIGFAALVLAVFALFLCRKVADQRFASVRVGSSVAQVRARFGEPSRATTIAAMTEGTVVLVNGCGDRDRECWYYLSRLRGDHFVCFDARNSVTCGGRAVIWR